MADVSTVATLSTDRLLLRPWRADDLEPFARINADPAVMEFFPATLSRAESDEMAARIESKMRSQGWGFWAVEEQNGESFIGFVGLALVTNMPFADGIEIGWRLATSHWGKGYATEAARAALSFAFNELSMEVWSFTTQGNQRSRVVMERLGMIDTGCDFIHPRVDPDNPLCKHVLYRMTSAQYRESASGQD